MPGSHGNAGSIQHLGHVMRVDTRDVERDDPASESGIERPVQVHVRVLRHQLDQGVADELALVLADAAHAERGQVVRRYPEADLGRDVRSARLELPRDLVELGPPQVDLADHLAAGQEGRHRFKERATRPERARTRWAEHLVPGEDVEIGIDRLDIHRHVGHGLGAVNEHQRPGLVSHPGHLGDRIDRPERVRNVRERDELRLELEEDLEDIEAEQAIVGDRDELEIRVLLLDQELPRDEVSVMLHLGQDDDIATGDVLAAPRIRHEVDRLGRVAGEHDLVPIRGVDEPRDARSGRFICRGGALADLVDAAMDVGVVLAVVGVHRIDHGLRLLARGRRVEVDQRLPVRGRRAENREVVANQLRDQAPIADPRVGCGSGLGTGGGSGHGIWPGIGHQGHC